MTETKGIETAEDHVEACKGEIQQLRERIIAVIGDLSRAVAVLSNLSSCAYAIGSHLDLIGAMAEDQGIDGIEFPDHIYRALEQIGFGNVAQLMTASKEEIQERARFSDSEMATIQRALKKAGLSLLSENKPQDPGAKP